EVKRLLGTTRLLTLTGPGGTGKTRLSLQVAADLLETFPHGIWLVELATLSEGSLVLDAVAAVVDVREGAGRPLHETLTDLRAARHARPRQLRALDRRVCRALRHAAPPLPGAAHPREQP